MGKKLIYSEDTFSRQTTGTVFYKEGKLNDFPNIPNGIFESWKYNFDAGKQVFRAETEDEQNGKIFEKRLIKDQFGSPRWTGWMEIPNAEAKGVQAIAVNDKPLQLPNSDGAIKLEITSDIIDTYSRSEINELISNIKIDTGKGEIEWPAGTERYVAKNGGWELALEQLSGSVASIGKTGNSLNLIGSGTAPNWNGKSIVDVVREQIGETSISREDATKFIVGGIDEGQILPSLTVSRLLEYILWGVPEGGVPPSITSTIKKISPENPMIEDISLTVQFNQNTGTTTEKIVKIILYNDDEMVASTEAYQTSGLFEYTFTAEKIFKANYNTFTFAFEMENGTIHKSEKVLSFNVGDCMRTAVITSITPTFVKSIAGATTVIVPITIVIRDDCIHEGAKIENVSIKLDNGSFKLLDNKDIKGAYPDFSINTEVEIIKDKTNELTVKAENKHGWGAEVKAIIGAEWAGFEVPDISSITPIFSGLDPDGKTITKGEDLFVTGFDIDLTYTGNKAIFLDISLDGYKIIDNREVITGKSEIRELNYKISIEKSPYYFISNVYTSNHEEESIKTEEIKIIWKDIEEVFFMGKTEGYFDEVLEDQCWEMPLEKIVDDLQPRSIEGFDIWLYPTFSNPKDDGYPFYFIQKYRSLEIQSVEGMSGNWNTNTPASYIKKIENHNFNSKENYNLWYFDSCASWGSSETVKLRIKIK